MLPWREGTVLDGAIANALSFCERVILVTGFRGSELHQRYAHHPAIELVHNASYQEGMFSSIQAGVKHIKARHFFIALGDMPAAGAGVYATLWRQRKETCLSPSISRVGVIRYCCRFRLLKK
ncbi:molybdenum hydroxylase accessory protein, YgfJ family [Raoultella terrigena]|uniref:Molybdenum hydroxylase accessory protein, YgfJ family n=1 Tax=Raoultella terrigena TaxID=577 RepID=A0A3P8KBK6_RAOTE|nr:molybdenum hydroxylase accessory protein, YgfJ family [Raoultella terrigena]